MTVTYEWEFSSFEKAPLVGELADVVKTIHWRLKATDGAYHTSAYGTVTLPDPDPDNFTAYEDITKQWAIDATSSVLDVATLEASLAADIDRLKNPPVVASPPPFEN